MIDWLNEYSFKLEGTQDSFERYQKAYQNLRKTADEKQIRKLKDQFKDLNEVKSIYLWGDPGCGKSFIMEKFYESLNIDKKKFLHYQEFMLQIHE